MTDDERVYKGWPLGPYTCPQAGLAARRDASWLSTPGTSRKVHVVAGDGGSKCSGMMLVLDAAVPLDQVPQNVRCQRHGCREAWARTAGEQQ